MSLNLIHDGVLDARYSNIKVDDPNHIQLHPQPHGETDDHGPVNNQNHVRQAGHWCFTVLPHCLIIRHRSVEKFRIHADTGKQLLFYTCSTVNPNVGSNVGSNVDFILDDGHTLAEYRLTSDSLTKGYTLTLNPDPSISRQFSYSDDGKYLAELSTSNKNPCQPSYLRLYKRKA